jgi:hypothetical protein
MKSQCFEQDFSLDLALAKNLLVTRGGMTAFWMPPNGPLDLCPSKHSYVSNATRSLRDRTCLTSISVEVSLYTRLPALFLFVGDRMSVEVSGLVRSEVPAQVIVESLLPPSIAIVNCPSIPRVGSMQYIISQLLRIDFSTSEKGIFVSQVLAHVCLSKRNNSGRIQFPRLCS